MKSLAQASGVRALPFCCFANTKTLSTLHKFHRHSACRRVSRQICRSFSFIVPCSAMVSRKELATRDGAAVVAVNTAEPPIPARKLPAYIRFPLLALVSLSVHTFLYSFVAPLSNYELSSVSRTLNEAWQPAAFLGYKILELAVGWYMKFDCTSFWHGVDVINCLCGYLVAND